MGNKKRNKKVTYKTPQTKPNATSSDPKSDPYSIESILELIVSVDPSFELSGSSKSTTILRNPNIILENVSIRDINGGGAFLVKNADLKFLRGHVYGVVGANGAGKSTLLHYLAKKKLTGIADSLRICLVSQELEESDLTALDFVCRSDRTSLRLLAYEKHLSSLKTPTAAEVALLRKVTELLEGRSAKDLRKGAAAVLVSLGFTEEALTSEIGALSGGWRMRVALAGALFADYDFVLLDEPTNHLDFDTLRFLVAKIKELAQFDPAATVAEVSLAAAPADLRKKGVLVVSHDRSFLNQVCSDIVHLADRRLVYYRGNFEVFLRSKQARDTCQNSLAEKQQRQLAHNEDFIRRFRANKKLASLAQSRVKANAKMQLVDKVAEEKSIAFSLGTPPRLGKDALVALDHVFFDYDAPAKEEPHVRYLQRCLLKDVSVRLALGSRAGLVGLNGSGKSTLLKLITGELEPVDGCASVNTNMRVGYFSQHATEALDPELTAFANVAQKHPAAGEADIYRRLGTFGLLGRRDAKVAELSGGQKARLHFLLTVWHPPHLLLLDEPTNHLDHLTIDAFVRALEDFAGAVLVVSHDRYFLDSVCAEVYSLSAEGRLAQHDAAEAALTEAYRLRDRFVLRKRVGTRDKTTLCKNKTVPKTVASPSVSHSNDDEIIFQFVERALQREQDPRLLLKMLGKKRSSCTHFKTISALVFHLADLFYDNKKDLRVLEPWRAVLSFVVSPEVNKGVQVCQETLSRVSRSQEDCVLLTTFFNL